LLVYYVLYVESINVSQVTALPSSIAVLSVNDCRVPANLVTTTTTTHSNSSTTTSSSNKDTAPIDSTCWLAPLATSLQSHQRIGMHEEQSENILHIRFTEPTCIAAINVCNYRKTPARGVKDVSILLDGRLIYMGTIAKVSKALFYHNFFVCALFIPI
jgi:Domain of unknown function (DUF4457)